MERRERSKSATVADRGTRWTAIEAQQILDEWATSGESMQEFAKARGLVPQRLAWWRKRLVRNPSRPVAGGAAVDAAPAFLPVVVRGRDPGAVVATVEIADRIRVELRALDSTTATWVASLAKALGTAS